MESSDGLSSDNNTKGKETRQKEFAESCTQYIASQPGQIPEGLGVVIVNNKYEWDNKLWMMHSHHIFYSIKSNCVYAGKTAAVANDYESHMVESYTTSEDH